MRMYLGVQIGEHSSDIAVDIEAEHTVAELRAALESYLGLHIPQLYSDSRAEPLTEHSRVAEAGLVSGNTLSDRSRHASAASTGTRLVVTQGHGVGQSTELTDQTITVGRDSSNDLVVTDPQISRQHFSVKVNSDDSIELLASESATNAVRINGLETQGVVAISDGDTIAAGGTTFAIRRRIVKPSPTTDRFGATPFNRTPYFRPGDPPAEFTPIELPSAQRAQRFRYLAVVSPLFAGIGMALFLDSPRFLLFAVLSPIMAIGNYIDQRYLSGKEHRESLERFDSDLKKRTAEIEVGLAQGRSQRFAQAPDIDELAFRAESQSELLWLRDRKASDFLELRLGIGEQPAGFDFTVDRKGVAAYRDRLDSVNAAGTVLSDVPITFSLPNVGALAVVGDDEPVASLTGSLVTQATCLHSPEDLIVIGMTQTERGMHRWMKWLPHTRSAASPLGGDHLSVGGENSASILKALAVVAAERAQVQDSQIDTRWPWILVVLDGELAPEAPVVSQILEHGPAVGISVVWMCRETATVPRQVQAVCKIPNTPSEPTVLSYVDTDRPDQRLDPERIDFPLAHQTATDLAALRDASSANAATAIPSMVTLLDVLGRGALDPDVIAQGWEADKGYTLAAPFAMSNDGPFELDLVNDGPHGLIGGTSGSGKSELLQSLLTGLVVRNSPKQLNLLFIDYKGGALSKKFDSIPHTVGSVTNLDALMANRALTSLLAELNYRMQLFDGLDMQKMLKERPDEAPASLVLVVDEFAALVRELPQFVDGVVSIAERGRSLGIHLLLATQRPSGSINDNIQQNTDLRIALRMISSSESSNVIGAPDAAGIPKPLQGRAIAKKSGRLVPIQSAYSEAPYFGDAQPEVAIKPFVVAGEAADIMQRTLVFTGGAFTKGSSKGDRSAHQLDRVLKAIAQVGADPGRSPWQAPLPDEITLTQANTQYDAPDNPTFRALVGVLDDPERQRQLLCQFDLTDGPLFAFGGAGSGKSTLLATVANAASERASEADASLSIIVFDFASRSLSSLRHLPHFGMYADSDDLESTTRAIALVEDEVKRRRSSLGANEGSASFDPILLVIDGWDNLDEALRPTTQGGQELHAWSDKIETLISQGRQFGVYTVAATSRLLRTKLMSSVPHRLILRQPGENEYRALGIASRLAKDLTLRPGQAIDADGTLIQVATPDPTQTSEAAHAKTSLSIAEALPDAIALPDDARNSEHPMLGRVDLGDRSIGFDPALRRLLLVGPPRSGKSSVLALLGQQMQDRGHDVYVVGSERSPLADPSFNWTTSIFGDAAQIAEFVAEHSKISESTCLLFDDLEEFDQRDVYSHFESLVGQAQLVLGSTAGVRRVSTQNPAFAHLKNGRANLFFQSTSRDINEAIGVRIDIRPGLKLSAGRALLLVDRVPTLIQCFQSKSANF